MFQKSALVLLSGGQDSTTCLFWAIANFEKVIALNVYYGQRHSIEMQAAKKIAKIAGVEYQEVNIGRVFAAIGDSALVEGGGDISAQHRVEDLPASFVPGRNILLLTLAAAVAYKQGISHIVTGVCQTDFSGYPDCRDNTIKAIQVSLSLGLNYDVVIHTPLMWLTKAETVFMANDIDKEGLPIFDALAHSHTCYEGQIPPCGKCPACILRAKGFEEAGLIDPLSSRLKKELSNGD